MKQIEAEKRLFKGKKFHSFIWFDSVINIKQICLSLVLCFLSCGFFCSCFIQPHLRCVYLRPGVASGCCFLGLNLPSELHVHLLSIYLSSWYSSCWQRMGWIIFWRPVPGRRETTGPMTSPLRSPSCSRLKVGRWRSSSTLLDHSYTTSIWGQPTSRHSIFSPHADGFSPPHFPFCSFPSRWQQGVGLHVRRPQRHQHEQPHGAGQHLQQLLLRWARTASSILRVMAGDVCLETFKHVFTFTIFIRVEVPVWCSWRQWGWNNKNEGSSATVFRTVVYNSCFELCF